MHALRTRLPTRPDTHPAPPDTHPDTGLVRHPDAWAHPGRHRSTARLGGLARDGLARAVAAGALLALVAGGCGTGEPAAGGAVQRPGEAAQAATTARRQLDGLTVGTWGSMAGYSRDRFPHWSAQGSGCDTRDVVLRRDGTGVRTEAGCKIAAGTWLSPYDGVSLTDPQEVDIDHMVPLANAWRNGASQWSEDDRERFANDLTRPQLIAVTASSNRAKGDQDPSQWRPPRRASWCRYAQDWVAVKSYWRLRVTAAEKAAIAEMLDTC